MKWLAYALGSLMARFLPSSSKGSGSPSQQIKVVEVKVQTPPPTLKQDKTISISVSNSEAERKQVMFSDLEEKFIEGYFNRTDMDMSEAEFSVAMKSLLACKVIQEVEVSGQTYYKLTPVGRAIYKHRHHSNPKDQN